MGDKNETSKAVALGLSINEGITVKNASSNNQPDKHTSQVKSDKPTPPPPPPPVRVK